MLMFCFNFGQKLLKVQLALTASSCTLTLHVNVSRYLLCNVFLTLHKCIYLSFKNILHIQKMYCIFIISVAKENH